MQENNFQELRLFEENAVNVFCDQLTSEVLNITGKKPHIVGSVAKILNGTLSEQYQPKDIDFAIDNISFRKLLQYHTNRKPLFQFSIMVEVRPERFIIYCEGIVIELWNFLYKNYSEILEFKENKIPYLCQ